MIKDLKLQINSCTKVQRLFFTVCHSSDAIDVFIMSIVTCILCILQGLLKVIYLRLQNSQR